MVRRFSLVFLLGLVFLQPAGLVFGVIQAITPLQVFLEDSTAIVLAKIDKIYPEKAALVLNVQEDLKGKAVYRRLPVVVKVDRAAENENYIPPIMKRLAAGQDLILFIKERGKKSTV